MRARRTSRLKTILTEKGPALVFAMIQKYRDTDIAGASETHMAGDETNESLGILNTDETIVILVDEAHRSQTSTLHANLMAALPNAAKIGFTGTPIMREGKKRTDAIFGPFIDKYTIRQAEHDGAVVPIFYEGRTAKGAVAGGSDLDELFEDMFVEHTAEEVEKLKARYATTGAVLEAPKLIAAKAKSMLWHYVSTVLPGGFKAQLSATSRLATVRYREALLRCPRRPRLPDRAVARAPGARRSRWQPRHRRPRSAQAGACPCASAPGSHSHPRLRSGHLGQQQRRPDLAAVDRQGSSGRRDRGVQEAAWSAR